MNTLSLLLGLGVLMAKKTLRNLLEEKNEKER